MSLGQFIKAAPELAAAWVPEPAVYRMPTQLEASEAERMRLAAQFEAQAKELAKLRAEHERLRDVYEVMRVDQECLIADHARLKANHQRLRKDAQLLREENEILREKHEVLREEHKRRGVSQGSDKAVQLVLGLMAAFEALPANTLALWRSILCDNLRAVSRVDTLSLHPDKFRHEAVKLFAEELFKLVSVK